MTQEHLENNFCFTVAYWVRVRHKEVYVYFPLERTLAPCSRTRCTCLEEDRPATGSKMSREMSSWSATLSDEVMAAARRAFERHDHDNSGTIQVEVSRFHGAKR